MTKIIVVRKKDVTVAESETWASPHNHYVGKVWGAGDYYFLEAKDGFKTTVPFIDLQMAFNMMIQPMIKVEQRLTLPDEMSKEDIKRLLEFVTSQREEINSALRGEYIAL